MLVIAFTKSVQGGAVVICGYWVVVVVVVVGSVCSGAVTSAGARRCSIPWKLIVGVSGAVTTAGASRLTVVVLMVSLSSRTVVTRLRNGISDAVWIVLVNEVRKFGSKSGAWPKPDVGYNTRVGSPTSTSLVVGGLSSLVTWNVESTVIQLSEMVFFEVG